MRNKKLYWDLYSKEILRENTVSSDFYALKCPQPFLGDCLSRSRICRSTSLERKVLKDQQEHWTDVELRRTAKTCSRMWKVPSSPDPGKSKTSWWLKSKGFIYNNRGFLSIVARRKMTTKRILIEKCRCFAVEINFWVWVKQKRCKARWWQDSCRLCCMR